MKKPWSGRFEEGTDEAVERFTESVSFDKRLYEQDIRASLAHAEMLQRCGLLSAGELEQIRAAMAEIRSDIRDGVFQFMVPLEDVHMNLEAALIDRAGAAGRKLHTARSRNDQVACDMRLWTRDALDAVDASLLETQRALVEKAEQYREAVMPGYTHLQHAQPVLLGHVLLAHVEALDRDRGRLADCRRRLDVSPLGACAMAGTTLPTDPPSTAAALGFGKCFNNSVDAVSDRDFAVECVFVMCMVAMHLSRLAEDWVLWATQEFDFIDLGESFCTGSSIMPQKKNPDVLELLRGRCARVYGDLTALLTVLKALPLAYNRDLQEDKEPLFHAVDTVTDMLGVSAGLVRATEFKADEMLAAAEEGHADATALAEYLVVQGVPFREAHGMVGRAVRAAAAEGKRLADLSLAQLRSFCATVDEDVYDLLGAHNCVQSYRSHGSSAPCELDRQLAGWRDRLGE
jgi:argininosuccinate lyase